jgi:phage shock protein PspC (stress-responsive transcriptional regulator)
MSDYQPQQPTQAPAQPPAQPKKLLRSRNDRWIAGVCGGVGEYAGVDPNLVRLLAVVAAVFTGGTLFLAYIVAWIVMPEA